MIKPDKKFTLGGGARYNFLFFIFLLTLLQSSIANYGPSCSPHGTLGRSPEMVMGTDQKSALGGAGDHPQGGWWGHRRQPILCRYGRQQWSVRVGARSLGLQFPLLHFQPLSPYPCQGIRSFQDLMPPPPGKPGPPPLQGGLGLRPCWYFVRVYIDSPGGEPLRVYGYRSFCPLCGRDGFACGETPTSLGSETRTSGDPPVVRSLRAHALHSALFTFGHE